MDARDLLCSILQVYLCGNSEKAKQEVSAMATRLGVTVLDRGSLSAASELEDFPLRLFPEWKLPLITAALIFAFFYVFLIIRDVIYARVEKGQDISYRIFISLGNKVRPVSSCRWSLVDATLAFPCPGCWSLCLSQVLPIVALVMLSLCYLPGAFAGFIQLYRGTKYKSVQTVAKVFPLLSSVEWPELPEPLPIPGVFLTGLTAGC